MGPIISMIETVVDERDSWILLRQREKPIQQFTLRLRETRYVSIQLIEEDIYAYRANHNRTQNATLVTEHCSLHGLHKFLAYLSPSHIKYYLASQHNPGERTGISWVSARVCRYGKFAFMIIGLPGEYVLSVRAWYRGWASGGTIFSIFCTHRCRVIVPVDPCM